MAVPKSKVSKQRRNKRRSSVWSASDRLLRKKRLLQSALCDSLFYTVP